MGGPQVDTKPWNPYKIMRTHWASHAEIICSCAAKIGQIPQYYADLPQAQQLIPPSQKP